MSTAHTGKSARHGQSWLRRGAGMLVIPALCWAVMALACALAGTSLLTGVSSLRLFVRGLTYVLLLSFGVSINMHTGRFDFSTGAVMLLGGVCGALIAYGNGWGPWGMLLISIPTGAAAGCVSGLLYILLRLPPMIIGLGMTLVLEGIVAIITDGCRPVGFGTDASYYRFSVNMPAMLALGGWALVLAAGCVFARYYVVAKKQFGGVTGDLAGWFLQKCEIWMLAALAVSQWGGVL